MQPRNMRQMPSRMNWQRPNSFGGGGGRGMFGPPQGGGGMRNGGLLSRIFQRQQPAQGAGGLFRGFSRAAQGPSVMQGFSRAAEGGSAIQGIANPQSIHSFLNQTQQVLKTAQQFGPMIQQYGPMVRNLPAMWRIYKGFKDSSTGSDTETNKAETDKKSDPIKAETEKSTVTDESNDKDEQTATKRKAGDSIPKLYV